MNVMRTRNIFQLTMLFAGISVFSQTTTAQLTDAAANSEFVFQGYNNLFDLNNLYAKRGAPYKIRNNGTLTSRYYQAILAPESRHPKIDDKGKWFLNIFMSASADYIKTLDKGANASGYSNNPILAANFFVHLILWELALSPLSKHEMSIEQEAWAVKLHDRFQIRADFGITGRGNNEKLDGDSYKLKIYYLVLHPYLLYNHPGGNGNFFAGVGPYYGYALFGKFIDKVNGETTKTKIKFGKDQSGIKHSDFGAGIVAGYIFNRVMIQLSYHLGLSNIGFDKENKLLNRALGFSIGYVLK
jgi:hypothetical protein